MDRQDYDHTKLEGNDVDIETSLKEYGLAWIETDTEYLFYYGIGQAENDCGDIDYIKFDFCFFDKDMDVFKEFDWVSFHKVLSFTDTSMDDFKKLPLSSQISDLLSYYGYENVFGSSYGEGLTYGDIVNTGQPKIEIQERGIMLSDYFCGTPGVMLPLCIGNKTTKKEIIEYLESEISALWEHVEYTANYNDFNGDIDAAIEEELNKMKVFIKGTENDIYAPDMEEIEEDDDMVEGPVAIFTIEFIND